MKEPLVSLQQLHLHYVSWLFAIAITYNNTFVSTKDFLLLKAQFNITIRELLSVEVTNGRDESNTPVSERRKFRTSNECGVWWTGGEQQRTVFIRWMSVHAPPPARDASNACSIFFTVPSKVTVPVWRKRGLQSIHQLPTEHLCRCRSIGVNSEPVFYLRTQTPHKQL